jgi:hypothetical protein
VAPVTGAGHVNDDVRRFVGESLGGGGLGVLGLAVHYADAVEEELADVSHGDGVFAGDALVGHLGEQIGQEEVDGGGGGEVADAGEERGGGESGFGRVPLPVDAARR